MIASPTSSPSHSGSSPTTTKILRFDISALGFHGACLSIVCMCCSSAAFCRPAPTSIQTSLSPGQPDDHPHRRPRPCQRSARRGSPEPFPSPSHRLPSSTKCSRTWSLRCRPPATTNHGPSPTATRFCAWAVAHLPTSRWPLGLTSRGGSLGAPGPFVIVGLGNRQRVRSTKSARLW